MHGEKAGGTLTRLAPVTRYTTGEAIAAPFTTCPASALSLRAGVLGPLLCGRNGRVDRPAVRRTLCLLAWP